MAGNEKDLPQPEKLDLTCVVRPKINLAFQQNAVPIIVELAVVNDTDKTFEDLNLHVESDPPFASPRD